MAIYERAKQAAQIGIVAGLFATSLGVLTTGITMFPKEPVTGPVASIRSLRASQAELSDAFPHMERQKDVKALYRHLGDEITRIESSSAHETQLADLEQTRADARMIGSVCTYGGASTAAVSTFSLGALGLYGARRRRKQQGY
jgi:MYXO-CTERM domain-containing protein